MIAEGKSGRQEVAQRAADHSPFLRALQQSWPDVVDSFVSDGGKTAVEAAVRAGAGEAPALLRRQRARLALAVALGDLSGELSLEEVTAALSDFADRAIDTALTRVIHDRVADAPAKGLCAIALGKLGSRELNYSSDVDLLLLYDPDLLPVAGRDDPGQAAERYGRKFVSLLQERTADGYVARVDLRLRPSPEVTPIVLPVRAAISYYESSALGWERAAFIRARVCGGDRALGRSFLEAIEPFVWRRALDFGVIEEIQAMTRAVRNHYAQGQTFGPGYDLKRGRGGIREVEFFAQAHQMIRGGRNPGLRQPATLDALAALSSAGHVDSMEAAELADSYRRLRTAEHRLQMVEDQQTHSIPKDPAAIDNVARLHGLADGAAFLGWLAPAVEATAVSFGALGEGDERTLPTGKETLAEELSRLGFEDVESASRRVGDWRSGRPRALRSSAARSAFEAMLPTLMAAIAQGSDPPHSLNRLSDIVERMSSGINFFRLLQARPDLSRLFARILAHAPALSDQLARRPELFDGVLDASSFSPPPSPDVIEHQLCAVMEGLPYDLAIDRARRTINEKRFALGVQCVDLRSPPLEVGQGYSRVAEGAIAALADTAIADFRESHGSFPGGELVIVALGRLGGGVLTYASDLDLIFLHTGDPDGRSDGRRALGPSDYFNRLASRVSAALSVPTAAGPLYEVDTRLRPEGAQGMLAVSLDAFAAYQRQGAWGWEHMALTRARPVYGSAKARDRTSAIVDSIVRIDRDFAEVARQAAAMRMEMARHKPPTGPLDVKLCEGGLVDLEFGVQALQLGRHVALRPDLEGAVDELVDAGLAGPDVADAQKFLTALLVMLRLVAPSGEIPTEGTRALLAEAMGVETWEALLARIEQARQSVTRFWKHIAEEAG